MKGHDDESPVIGCHMQLSCKRHVSIDVQECKYVPGHHDSAYHQPDHGGKQQKIDYQPEHSIQGIFPFRQIFIPLNVQNMMDDE